MKKLFTLLLLFICIESIAQTPNEEKRKQEKEAIYNRQGFFRPNTEFEKNKRNYSEDKRYCFVFQEDGNLVIYRMYSENSYKAIWQTHTNGKAIKKCVFQGDGNLVLYDYNNKAIWAAFTTQYYNTTPRKSLTTVLVMQSDGNLVIYDDHFSHDYIGRGRLSSLIGADIGWASGTSGK